MSDLTHADIDLLMDGLESIEKAAQSADAMGSIMTSMFSSMAFKDDPIAMEKAKREDDLRREKERLSRRRKQEDVFILRAKLVTIRRELDSEVAGRIIDEAQRPSVSGNGLR